MKKDKIWLKEQLKHEEVDLKHAFDNYVPYEKVLIADDVNELLNELEEPEQDIDVACDLLQENTTLSQEDFDLYWNCINDGVAVSELKQEKPVVPQFVAEYIEERKGMSEHWFEALDSLVVDFHNNDTNKTGDRIFNWIMANPDLYVEGYRNGYTVEKEPQWVVKDDTGYLSYLRFSIPNIYERETSLDKNDAYKFNSKSKADLIADLVTGTVEEVTK